jgi:ribosomal protein S27AE
MQLSTIDRLLNEALCYNDSAWCKQKSLQFKSTKGAESLELALYICPSCGERASMHSSGNLFTCRQCGFTIEYQYDSSFLLSSKGNRESYLPPFDEAPFLDSIVSWNSFQSRLLYRYLSGLEKVNLETPFFFDEPVKLKRGKRMDRMETLIIGRIELYIDRLEFHDTRNAKLESIVFPIEQIDGEGVLKWNFFEFYNGMNVYRVVFKDKKASGRKYSDAISVLHQISGSHFPGR